MSDAPHGDAATASTTSTAATGEGDGPVEIVLPPDEVGHVVTIAQTIVTVHGLGLPESFARALNLWVSLQADLRSDGGIEIPNYPGYERVSAHLDGRGHVLRFEGPDGPPAAGP